MRGLIVCFALIVVLFIAGCATQAQREYARITEQLVQTLELSTDCYEPVFHSAPAQRLESRLIVDPNTPDPNRVQKLIINELASSQEKADVLSIMGASSRCDEIVIEGLGLAHPKYLIIRTNSEMKRFDDVAALLQDEITIGEFNKRTMHRHQASLEEWDRIGEQIIAQLNQAHYYEAQQRQQAAAALQQWSYQQQLLYQNQQVINSLNAPTTTNCYYVGNTVQCTSY